MAVINPTLGPEYGTTEAAWKGVLSEADRRAELHVRYVVLLSFHHLV